MITPAMNNDPAEVKDFARERTADDDAVSILDIHIVNAELVGGPAHCPAARVVASYLKMYDLSKWTYSIIYWIVYLPINIIILLTF